MKIVLYKGGNAVAVHNRSRWNTADNKKMTNPLSLIIRGTCISFIFSLLSVLLLAIFTLVSDSEYLEAYLEYIMVAISIGSIFLGSVLATQKAEAKGLLIGMSVGILYVGISVLIGMELNNDAATTLVLLNKLLAGVAAGALGGLVGVNL